VDCTVLTWSRFPYEYATESSHSICSREFRDQLISRTIHHGIHKITREVHRKAKYAWTNIIIHNIAKVHEKVWRFMRRRRRRRRRKLRSIC
jgi:hypothetical protein